MTPEDEQKLLAARPSWQDARGLFPDYVSKPFPPAEPARITRTESQFLVNERLEQPLPTNPAPQPTCPTSGTITAVFSGTAPCGCKAVGLSDSQQVTTFSGLTGSHTLTWDGVAHFSLLGIGVFEVTLYADGSCGAVGSVSTDTFDILAQCSDGLWTVTVQGSTALANIFTTGTPEPLGSPISNALTCVAGPTGDIIGDGNVTLS